jgi:hypothetical protein
MTYTINAAKTGNRQYDIDVIIKDGDTTILEGHTSVLTADEVEAIAYIENYYLPDIRRNVPDVLGGLELPCDIVTPVVEEGTPIEGGDGE